MEDKNTQQLKADSFKKIAHTNRGWLAFVITVVVIVFLIGLSGYILYSPEQDIYQGQVSIKEIRISGKVPGRITRFRVQEGQFVHKGDTLVDIYAPEVLAKEAQAQATDQLAIALQKGLTGVTTTELRQMSLNAWLAAKEALEVGQKSYARAKHLFDEGVIPAQKLDETKAKLSTLQAAEKITHNQYILAQKGILSQNKQATQALINQSKGLLKEVNAYMKDMSLISPIDGMVSDIFPNKGELVGPGAPIMNIADDQAVNILIPVREDHLSLFPKGKEISAYVPALSNRKIKIRVKKYRDMGIYAIDKATKTKGGIDLRNFEVTAVPTDTISGLQSGMSVIIDK